jgi:hypothetical protein
MAQPHIEFSVAGPAWGAWEPITKLMSAANIKSSDLVLANLSLDLIAIRFSDFGCDIRYDMAIVAQKPIKGVVLQDKQEAIAFFNSLIETVVTVLKISDFAMKLTTMTAPAADGLLDHTKPNVNEKHFNFAKMYGEYVKSQGKPNIQQVPKTPPFPGGGKIQYSKDKPIFMQWDTLEDKVDVSKEAVVTSAVGKPLNSYLAGALKPASALPPFKEATQLYQMVMGTTSEYCIVAMAPKLKVGARVWGQTLSIRYEGDDLDVVTGALKTAGFKVTATYATLHVEIPTTSNISLWQRAMASMIAASMYDFDTPLPSILKVQKCFPKNNFGL